MIRYIAATGSLGYGFLEGTLEAAVAQHPDFIGCDAGSNDHGPNDLGAGIPHLGVATTMRDLRLLLIAARRARIPLIIGSAGGSGADVQVQWTLDILKRIATDEKLSFRLAVIHAEVPKEWVHKAAKNGRIKPLDSWWPQLDSETIEQTTRVVGQMGPEAFMQALQKGADVVIAGRSTDTSIYCSYPLLKGADPALAWHAGKIVECGAALAEHRIVPDSVMAEIGDDYFRVWSTNPDMRVTPQSVMAHTLYENGDPFLLVEPGCILDTSKSVYTAASAGGVEVRGSQYQRQPYTVKLEGARKAGFRAITLAGIRDPVLLADLNGFLESTEKRARSKIASVVGKDTAYQLKFRVYGYNGTLDDREPRRSEFSGYEVGLVIDAVAATQELANTVLSIARLTVLHNPVPRSHGFTTNVAFPFAPSDISVGQVYEWTLNHVVSLDDPLEIFPIEYHDVKTGTFGPKEH
ncbi:MAG: acyclic terpene utilization AtuA family protein [Betaproteobacteria bacterium]|nr:acyclic terpene utilization AtuA family protein [Betaproteobacteria bacterium]